MRSLLIQTFRLSPTQSDSLSLGAIYWLLWARTKAIQLSYETALHSKIISAGIWDGVYVIIEESVFLHKTYFVQKHIIAQNMQKIYFLR